jgi:hypothetical protein
MILLILFSIALIALAVVYFWISLRFKYFSRHGVLGPKPKFPYGNTKEAYEGKRNMVYDIDDIYRYKNFETIFSGLDNS